MEQHRSTCLSVCDGLGPCLKPSDRFHMWGRIPLNRVSRHVRTRTSPFIMCHLIFSNIAIDILVFETYIVNAHHIIRDLSVFVASERSSRWAILTRNSGWLAFT
jgi:hypothetical protein